ncbi:MAG: FecR/PupR family sigma factor regulator [Brevundimonas sp.]
MTSHGQTPYSSHLLRASAHRLRRHAARWVIRLTSGDATPGDLAVFRRWRDHHPENQAALQAMREAWLFLRPHPGAKADLPPPPAPPVEPALPVSNFASGAYAKQMVSECQSWT